MSYHQDHISSLTFDTERFIEEIKIRPAIYDVNSEEYGDRIAKTNAWDQVCEVMITKWRSLSDEEKNAEEKILRGKWRNIRDYFMKELKVLKLRKDSPAGRKRKKYMYFDQLLFLMPSIEYKKSKSQYINCKTRPKITVPARDIDNASSIDDYDFPLTHDSVSEDYTNSTPEEDVEYKYVPPAQFIKSICETSMVPPLAFSETTTNGGNQRPRAEDEDDYDRMFLLSLLPIIRKVPEEKKLDVRIQMQQVLSQAIRNASSSS